MSEMLRRAARRLLDQVLLPPQDREEKGYPPTGPDVGILADNNNNNNNNRPLAVITTTDNALIPPNDKLLVFRALTGIDTVPTLTSAGHARRAAPNIGIYQRVVFAERRAARGYRVFNIFVNGCLGAQVIVASTLTALGAANGSSVAVTGFGAINTIIAGILTYLKGSGLPGRLKHTENQFKAVREYVEQREREFCLADCALDPRDEVQMVEDMYRAAKQDFDGSNARAQQGGGANMSHQHAGSRVASLASVVPAPRAVNHIISKMTTARHEGPTPGKSEGEGGHGPWPT